MAESTRIDEWRRLLDTAQRFREAEPWRWLSDWPLLGLQDPVTGQFGFASVMGAAGEAFGLLVFRGAEGLWTNARIVELDEMGTWTHRAVMREMDALSFNLGDREDVSPALRKIYRQAGYSFRGRNNWPVFTSFLPGYANAEPSGDEIGLLTRWLNRALLFVELLADHDVLYADFLAASAFPDEDNDGMFHVLSLVAPEHLDGRGTEDESDADDTGDDSGVAGTEDGSGTDGTEQLPLFGVEEGADALGGPTSVLQSDVGSDAGAAEGEVPAVAPDSEDGDDFEDKLAVGWVSARPVRPLNVHLYFDEMAAARLRRRLPKRPTAWEFEVCPTPLLVGEARGRAQSVQVALAVEEGSGIILGFEMLAGPDPLEPARHLLDFVKETGYIPAEVGVTREDVAFGVSALTEALGIELTLYDRLPDLEEAFNSMMEHLLNE